MKENMEERAERLALYIIENRTTVRAAAQKFGISKSTVHTDVTNGNGLYRLCSRDRFHPILFCFGHDTISLKFFYLVMIP